MDEAKQMLELDGACQSIQKARAIVDLIAAAEDNEGWNKGDNIGWATIVIDDLLADAQKAIEGTKGPRAVEVAA